MASKGNEVKVLRFSPFESERKLLLLLHDYVNEQWDRIFIFLQEREDSSLTLYGLLDYVYGGDSVDDFLALNLTKIKNTMRQYSRAQLRRVEDLVERVLINNVKLLILHALVESLIEYCKMMDEAINFTEFELPNSDIFPEHDAETKEAKVISFRSFFLASLQDIDLPFTPPQLRAFLDSLGSIDMLLQQKLVKAPIEG